jgi:hypothetical protein
MYNRKTAFKNVLNLIKKTMSYKIIILTLYLLIACLSNTYSRGFGDWQVETPYKNTIDNYSGNGKTLRIKGNYLDSLDRWYFYNTHVVGKREKGKGYFIADEVSRNMQCFDSEADWGKTIDEKDLAPWLITRWHEGGEEYIFGLIFLFVFGGFIIMIPLILAYLYAVYLAIRSGFKLNDPYTIVTLGMPLWIVIPWLLEVFPQSF